MFVEIDAAVVDADVVSGNADDALDETLGGIEGIAEDDDVAAVNGLDAIDELVDEDVFLVGEGGHHAGAFDFHRGVEEHDDEGDEAEGDDQVAEPGGEEGVVATGGGLRARGYRRWDQA